MVHHYKLIVFRILLGSFLISTMLYSKDIPIMKTIEVNIPVNEYSIIDFPFKIKELQTKTFNYKTVVTKQVPLEQKSSANGISLSKKDEIKKPQVKNDILGLEKGLNVLTFKPKSLGFAEMIVWGYELFPIILKINVVEAQNGDKYLKFVEILENKNEIQKFESSSHEKIIEEITRHLYDEKYSSKPVGYESIVRNASYSVNVLGKNKEIIGVIKNTLIREIVGRDYLGQVWNVNFIPSSEEYWSTEIQLYEEMFDDDGVYGVSLETYGVTKEHGTRVMVIRRRD